MDQRQLTQMVDRAVVVVNQQTYLDQTMAQIADMAWDEACGEFTQGGVQDAVETAFLAGMMLLENYLTHLTDKDLFLET